MALASGQRVTLLRIDDMLAMTHRHELQVHTVLDPQRVGYEGRKCRVAIVRQRGKRKDFYLDLTADDILLDEWGLPFRTDGEAGGVIAGNACYNLMGDPEAIRELIETRGALPVSDDAKAKIIVSRMQRTRCNDDGLLHTNTNVQTLETVLEWLKFLGFLRFRNPQRPVTARFTRTSASAAVSA